MIEPRPSSDATPQGERAESAASEPSASGDRGAPTPRRRPVVVRLFGFAGPLDIYIIAIGVLVGILLGPGVLGRLAPSVYATIFIGDQAVAEKIEQARETHRQQVIEDLERLELTEVSPEAVEEYQARADAELQAELAQLGAEAMAARQVRADRLDGLRRALILTLVLVMLLESVHATSARRRATPRDGERLTGIVAARYVLIAGWLTLFLAQPRMLSTTPWGLWVILAGISLLAALVPLSPKPQDAEEIDADDDRAPGDTGRAG